MSDWLNSSNVPWKNDRSSIQSVSFPDGLTSIGGYAFSGCTGLTSVTIPEGVTSIENSAFYGCKGLTSLTLPEGLKSIGSNAFSGCTGLSRVSLPTSLEIVRSKAFIGCGNMFHVLYASDEETWENVVIEGANEALTNAPYFHYNTTGWEPHVTKVPSNPATCTEVGTAACTCPCGYGWYEDIPALGHDYVASEIAAPTCVEGGFTIFACTRCGEEKTEELSPLGHDYVDCQCVRCGKWDPDLNPFSDVKEGKYYYNAVLWAVENGVTKGADATHFAPNQTCTRGQVVTFLYNTLAK